MRHFLSLSVVASVLMVFATPVRAADEQPMAGGKKLSEWMAMLRESENGRLLNYVTLNVREGSVTDLAVNDFQYRRGGRLYGGGWWWSLGHQDWRGDGNYKGGS